MSKAFTWCAEQINTEGTWLNETWTAIQDAVHALLDYVSAIFDSLYAAFEWCVEQINANAETLKQIWENIKSFITAAIDVIKNVINLFISVLKGDWSAAWDAIKGIVSSVWDAIKSAISAAIGVVSTTISTVMAAIKSVISNIWGGIKGIVSNAINDVKSSISSGLESAKSTVSSVLDGIKTKFSGIWESCKTIVKNAVTALKNALKFNWELPKLKLPHIKVKGGVAPYGIGGKGSLPSFSISWYKKAYDNAMILSKPTIFGYSAASGKFLGGGDGNGNEIVAGESYLMGLISKTVESKNEKIVSLLAALLEATVDGNAEMARAMMSERTFAVGEREFARLVKTYA